MSAAVPELELPGTALLAEPAAPPALWKGRGALSGESGVRFERGATECGFFVCAASACAREDVPRSACQDPTAPSRVRVAPALAVAARARVCGVR